MLNPKLFYYKHAWISTGKTVYWINHTSAKGLLCSRGFPTDIPINITNLLAQNYPFFLRSTAPNFTIDQGLSTIQLWMTLWCEDCLMESYEWDGDVIMGVTHEMPA